MISISPINRTKSPNPLIKIGLGENTSKLNEKIEIKTTTNNIRLESPKRLFDAFCDYTSIAGFRFLHSRHPIWFRILSAIVLFGSIGIFIYHCSIYVSRFIDKRNSIQMYTTKVQNITVPNIIICPVRQFRSVLRYDGPPDFLHIVSNYYNSPKQVPIFDGHSINATTIKARAFSQNFLKNVSNIEINLSKAQNNKIEEFIEKLIEKSEKFINDKTYDKLFPQCVLLMKFKSLRNMINDKANIYSNYDNFLEWQLHNNDSCFKNFIGENNQNPKSLLNTLIFIKFIKCRAERIVDLLKEIITKINNFENYAHNAKPSLEEYVVFCRWLDGGPCVLDWIKSENGIDCIKISGKNKIVASYITLRNDIDIVLDLFAMDNQLSTWDNRELRIILSGDENEKSVCTNIDGFI